MAELPIYLPLVAAGLAGLIFGFGKHWENACLIVCLAVPSVMVALFLLRSPNLFSLFWGLIALITFVVWTFVVWGLCAGINHAATKLNSRLRAR